MSALCCRLGRGVAVNRPLPGAVLWDMDGLLVDTEPLWTLAEHELADRLGGVFTADAKAVIVGTIFDVAAPTFLRHLGHEVTLKAVDSGTRQLLDRTVELLAGPLPRQPGVEQLLEAVAAAGVP